MGILDSILSAGGGDSIRQLAGNLGISEGQATQVISQLAPSLSQGIKKNLSSSEGLGSLLGALNSGNAQRYVDNPSEIGNEASIEEGNNILGQLFGSKDVSRSVAQSAAEQTGVDSNIIKKMLPMVAAMAMGSLSKNSSASGLANQLSGGMPSGDLSAMLTGFLDADKDGSIADDLMGMAKKLF